MTVNSLAAALNPEDTWAMLSGALREIYGADARLEDCAAHLLTNRSQNRVIRYDLRIRSASRTDVQRCQWVGKFYESEEDVCRVASVLRGLAAADCNARGGVILPRVVASDATRRVLFCTYHEGESVTAAIAQDKGRVLTAVGRALAALHATAAP